MLLFDSARDDAAQWESYGRKGSGVCLGIRILEEPGVVDDKIVSTTLDVVYSESLLRDSLLEPFDVIKKKLSVYSPTPFVCEEGLSALYRLSAYAAIRAKHDKWSAEKEVRLATFARNVSDIEPQVRVAEDGRIIRYIPVSLRADEKLIALEEIIIGPNQDTEETRRDFELLLNAKGYMPGTKEFLGSQYPM